MRRTVWICACTLLGGFATSTALAQQSMPAGMPGPGAASPSDREMMQGMQRMQADMTAVPMTGDPDRDFVAMMLPHHRGAVDMAQVELRYGRDPAMRKLAKAIVAAQDREIAEMTRWQARHPGR